MLTFNIQLYFHVANVVNVRQTEGFLCCSRQLLGKCEVMARLKKISNTSQVASSDLITSCSTQTEYKNHVKSYKHKKFNRIQTV